MRRIGIAKFIFGMRFWLHQFGDKVKNASSWCVECWWCGAFHGEEFVHIWTACQGINSNAPPEWIKNVAMLAKLIPKQSGLLFGVFGVFLLFACWIREWAQRGRKCISVYIGEWYGNGLRQGQLFYKRLLCSWIACFVDKCCKFKASAPNCHL